MPDNRCPVCERLIGLTSSHCRPCSAKVNNGWRDRLKVSEPFRFPTGLRGPGGELEHGYTSTPYMRKFRS